ncbi:MULTISPECIES: hypothetical protein [Streptomyces]|uniref:Uncharacterized protein n=1 Tax=Streptomyces venezuelae TaxID=54571 RepID=A0A5P2B5M6_STRVZ|nr:hypothetical protein [Streptomyces venezuelae]QES24481.1 hypothetical protein DEJ46_08495 [Streptomyces venezuelae]
MTYVVTVEIRVPEGAPELDGLHRVGATALLEQGFASVAGIEGADGMEMDLFDVAVAVHPRGATLKVMVAAPSLEFAEEAVGSVSEEVLERSELLAEWTVESSEVQLHTDAARESLEAADGPGAPPSDPQARRAHHTAKPDTADEPEQEAQDHEAAFRALAARLRSFGPAAFGVAEARAEAGAVARAGSGAETRPEDEGTEGAGTGESGDGLPAISPESAELAAGSLVYGAEVLIDELYDDVQTLAEEDTTVAECQGHLWHFDQLPSRHALQYNELFARRFLVTAIALTTRFTDGSFRRLGCLAEELVLKLLLEQAHVTLDLHGLLDEEVAAALGRFAGEVYEDMDFAWLQDTGEDGADGGGGGGEGAASGFGTWFTPFDDARYVHPYALDEMPETGVPDTAEN